MKKDIKNYDKKGRYHGYQEWYRDIELDARGNAIFTTNTSVWKGYVERYFYNGKISRLTFWIS